MKKLKMSQQKLSCSSFELIWKEGCCENISLRRSNLNSFGKASCVISFNSFARYYYNDNVFKDVVDL
jgi:hypothetical protein